MPDTLINSRLEPIREICNPLKITVDLIIFDDRYYIHFDGTKTYPAGIKWTMFWTSFDSYVSFLLTSHGFKKATIYVPTLNEHINVAFIGTLFDFLKANNE